MSPLVRPATAADAEPIARVHVATWQAAYAGLLPADYLTAMSNSVQQRADRWRTSVATSGSTVLVVDAANNRDGLAGFVAVGPSRDAGAAKRTGELMAIYVNPQFWGDRIGAALHVAGLASLAEAGNATATLWVLDTNQRARAFYERHGWSLDGNSKSEEIGGVTVTELRYTTHLVG
jgi:ribosomal protein S18 acetylase RimI-like enzyme